MELQSIKIRGFRRFKEEVELFTNGKLVALLGPNEAGKSSILEAIRLVGTNEPIPQTDVSRGKSSEDTLISASFFLDQEDLNAAGLTNKCWFVLTKSIAGNRRWKFDPPAHKRNTEHRKSTRSILEKIQSNTKLWGRIVQEDSEISEQYEECKIILESSDETLEASELESLGELASRLDALPETNDPLYFKNAAQQISECVESEQTDTPTTRAGSVILSRLPKILFFSNNERILQGQYNIPELATVVPEALANLCKIAKLDIEKLVEVHAAGDIPAVERLKKLANRELESRFDESWSQSGVHVAFAINDANLVVLVEDSDANFTRLAERSDGLRQFVALQSFTTCERAENPILLIDEAELRLHYDAQADLIQMLTKQAVTPKIIYTTHSAGCLPEDLGNGVRLISYVDDKENESVIKNQFWNRHEGGFEPLLIGMGATTLAFFPIRKALLTEGESDMLLLPTMLREALFTGSLGFQIVPGISKTSGINLPILARSGTGVGFALDWDPGGRELAAKIKKAGFDAKSIVHFSSARNKDYQLEDFINPSLLAPAVNKAMRIIGLDKPDIGKGSLSGTGKLEKIKSHFGFKKVADIPKVLIAYEILAQAINHPELPVLDKTHKKVFKKFAESVSPLLSV